MDHTFDDIRPYRDHEVHQVLEQLLNDNQFVNVFKTVFPHKDYDQTKDFLLTICGQLEFQQKFILPVVKEASGISVKSRVLEGGSNIIEGEGQLFISNHRDIILDPGFLNILRAEHGFNTSEIAVGDNLLVYPWIEQLMKLNKSFLVRRGVGVRQQLENSKRLSEYIHYTTGQLKNDVWIAQREGRAKDSDDRTQEALLKMLTLGSQLNPRAALLNLHITPMTVSYEFDPCDYLKAAEFQAKRDNPNYKKSQQDDLVNMQTGLFGYKGEIVFRISPDINSQIEALPDALSKSELVSVVSKIIDSSIHQNYHIFSNNYIALDLRNGSTAESAHYTSEQKNAFEAYLDKQIARVSVKNPDPDFLRERILTMYSNPLINHRLALQP